MDKLTPQQRHKNMAAIRSKDTKPEMIVRRGLWKRGFRYRLNHKRLPGHPDLVLRKYRTCIFVNGCFWHAHKGCRYFVMPKSNQEFWKNKLQRNKERDSENLKYYQEQCWRVCFVWECAIRGKNSKYKIEQVTNQIIQWLEEPDETFLEIKG